MADQVVDKAVGTLGVEVLGDLDADRQVEDATQVDRLPEVDRPEMGGVHPQLFEWDIGTIHSHRIADAEPKQCGGPDARAAPHIDRTLRA